MTIGSTISGAVGLVNQTGNLYLGNRHDYSVLNLEGRKATLDNQVKFYTADIQRKTGRDIGSIMGADGVQTEDGIQAELASIERLSRDDAGSPIQQATPIKQAAAPSPMAAPRPTDEFTA